MAENNALITKICQTLSVSSLIMLPLSALGTRFEFWHFGVGMAMYSVALLFAFITVILVALTSRRRDARERKLLTRCSFYSLPAILFTAVILGGSSDAPAIHDISTDLNNPPQFVAGITQRGDQSNPLDFNGEVKRKQKEAYPDLLPTLTELSPQQAFDRAEKIAMEMGWEIYNGSADDGIIEAVDTTFWFGFKDDVVIRISPDRAGSLIDLRSVSRVGKGDMGANAKRIRKFLDAYKEGL